MQKRRGVWWVLLGLGAAVSLGACFMSSDEVAGSPSGRGGGATTSPTGGAGPGGGPHAGGGGNGTDYSLDTEMAIGPGAGGGENDFEIPDECRDLSQEQAVVLYPPTPDSSAMASPVHARELLEARQAPTAIRTEEFLNYYRIGYATPAPAPGTLAIEAHAAPRDEPGSYDLQIGVRSFDAVLPRSHMTVTFVLDTSGSMSVASILREKALVEAVAQSLHTGDVVNMVTWDTSDGALLSGHVVTGASDPTVLAAASELSAGGGTDLHGGLVAGYALAEAHQQVGWLNRVILVSDGGTNIGVTDETLIANLSEEARQHGIHMIGVGVGPAEGYNDLLMQTVTDQGRGAYVYLDSEEEARHMFVERFDEVMVVAARAVQVELILPWYFHMEEQLGDELADAPTQVDPQHLAPSDAMIIHQVIQACSSQMIDYDTSSWYRIEGNVTWQRADDGEFESTPIDIGIHELIHDPDKAPLHKGLAIVAYAEALETGTAIALQSALDTVDLARADGPDADLDDIARLIALHPEYLPQ